MSPATDSTTSTSTSTTTGVPLSAHVPGRSWLLVIPDPGAGWLSSNGSRHVHWATRARAIRAWRNAAAVHARAAHLPALQRVHIVALAHHATTRRRDAANLAPTAKACVDGLRDAGVLTDDDDAHVIGPDMRTGARVSPGRAVRLTLLITELLDPDTTDGEDYR